MAPRKSKASDFDYTQSKAYEKLLDLTSKEVFDHLVQAMGDNENYLKVHVLFMVAFESLEFNDNPSLEQVTLLRRSALFLSRRYPAFASENYGERDIDGFMEAMNRDITRVQEYVVAHSEY